MNHKLRILAIMLLFILSPSIAAAAGFGRMWPINENRTQKAFPSSAEIKCSGFSAIREWYDDRFGLRDVLIRLQHQMDYSLFGYNKTLFFAESNEGEYLFYRSVVANEQIQNEAMTKEDQQAILTRLTEVKELLEQQDICFRFIIPPQKNGVLTEEAGQLPVSRAEKYMYYVMQEAYMKSPLRENYVNVMDILKEKNQVHPVFYHTDFHWNDWGAACAFGGVVNSYAASLGMSGVYDVDRLEFRAFVPAPDYAQLSNLSVFKYDIPTEYTVHDPGMAERAITISDAGGFLYWENQDKTPFSRSALFIGDSYTPPALFSFNETSSGLTGLFPRVYFCHWDNAEDVLSRIPPDVGLVVVESIESNYFLFAEKLGRLCPP